MHACMTLWGTPGTLIAAATMLGDLGVGLFAADCLVGKGAMPMLERWAA